MSSGPGVGDCFANHSFIVNSPPSGLEEALIVDIDGKTTEEEPSCFSLDRKEAKTYRKLQEKTQENPYFTPNYEEHKGFPGFFL